MGKNEILEKIKKELDTEISSECQVVYILSRIRKYLEILNENDKKIDRKYKYLKFFCDWALHSKINRTKHIKEILPNPNTPRRKTFVFFKKLRCELGSFLSETGLPRQIVKDEKKWQTLLILLNGIYADTPLIVRSQDGLDEIVIIEPEIKNGSYVLGFYVRTHD